MQINKNDIYMNAEIITALSGHMSVWHGLSALSAEIQLSMALSHFYLLSAFVLNHLLKNVYMADKLGR